MTQNTLTPTLGRLTTADFSLRAATTATDQLAGDIKWTSVRDAARLASEVASLKATLQMIEDELRAAS